MNIFFGSTHITLVLGGNTSVLLTLKALDAVAIGLAGLVDVGQGGIALVLGLGAHVLDTGEVLSTVTINVASLVELSQRGVASSLGNHAGAGVVAVLVGFAVVVDLASTVLGLGLGLGLGLLSGRSHGKTSKHGGNNEGGLHFGGWGFECGKV